jgi:predicted ATPase
MTQMNRFVVAETFGVKAPRGLTVEGFADPTHPQIPVKRPYVFREQLRDVLAFLADPAGDGLLLTGPTGAGKTSLVVPVYPPLPSRRSDYHKVRRQSSDDVQEYGASVKPRRAGAATPPA